MKFNPNQPREPAGSSEGGRWTTGGREEGGDIAFDEPGFNLSTLLGDLFEELPDFDLSTIFTLRDGESSDGAGDFTFVVGDQPQVSVDDETTPPVQLVSDTNNSGNGNDLEPLPKIPEKRPEDSKDRTSVSKQLGRWFGRNVGKATSAAAVIDGLGEQVDYIGKNVEAIKSYADPPKSLEELHDEVANARKGYEKHHIDENSLLEKLGFSKSERDRRDNLVLIPVLKHLDINGYYSKPSEDFGGLSPRQYLADKTAEERRRVGLETLVKFGVLKP